MAKKDEGFVDAKKVTARQFSETSLLFEIFSHNNNIVLATIGLLILGVVYPVTLFLSIIVALIFLCYLSSKPFDMPIRYPMDVDMIDDSIKQVEMQQHKIGFIKWTSEKLIPKKGKGILYLGYERGKNFGREIWLSLDDALRHIQLFATTGSGKSEAIFSICLNALSWGRGFCLSDGKGDPKLAYAIWSLARRFGREDDFLVMNFITGSQDKFETLIAGQAPHSNSNTINLFTGTPTFIIQLMSSLLPQIGNGEGGWQEKAKGMISALIYALCYKRSLEGITLSQSLIQEYLPLRKLAELYTESQENNWHEEGYKPLENFLSSLAGFDMNKISKPSEWSVEVFNQHGYLIQQFNKMLTMFSDIYGHVFSKDQGDISIRDVLHNDRILLTLIPSLELDKSEASSIGGFYISSIRMNISQDIGSKLEGTQEEVVLTEKYNKAFPYPIIFDELGNYAAQGLATMAAQMRSLQYMLMTASQDAQGINRGFDEFDSISANQRTKWCMALEDAKDTYEIFRKAGGTGYYEELSGVNQEFGLLGSRYIDATSRTIREKDNIELSELKDLRPGEGVVFFQAKNIRSQALYIEDQHKLSKLPMKLNRFVAMEKPSLLKLSEYVEIELPTTNIEIDKLGHELLSEKEAFTLVSPTLKDFVNSVLDAETNPELKLSFKEMGEHHFNNLVELTKMKTKVTVFNRKRTQKPIDVSIEDIKHLLPEKKSK